MPISPKNYFGGLHSRLDNLYECHCEDCSKLDADNNKNEKVFKEVLNAAEKALKHLHKKGNYQAEDINDKLYQNLINETYKVFDETIRDNDIPEEMREKLQNDAFIFSGLKTHSQLLEASTMLLDKEGKIRSFEQFAQDFNKVNKKYNQNYLEAEWQFAISSSQSAANWAKVDKTGRYNLQYRTANDDKVRDQHRALHDITLPKDDEFWSSYYPPNGWRCRCRVVEVLKDKYELSNSETALQLGEKATTQIGANGKNKLEIFRFNPGAEQKLFPPKHPYNRVKGAETVKKILEDKKPSLLEKELKTPKDLSLHFKSFAEQNPEFFIRGFKEIKITRQRGVNGFTDMNGSIALKSDITDLCISAINNIKQGKPTSFEQERALSTLHHEIWHNANKPGNMRMSTAQVKTMELANEYVSRKTLPLFLEKLGGKLQNEELTKNRNNTGYNTMVVNYDKLIEWAKADEKKVINAVKTTLIEDKYTEQKQGLINAIVENSNYQISNNVVSTLIDYAQKYDNDSFKKLLEKNKELREDGIK